MVAEAFFKVCLRRLKAVDCGNSLAVESQVDGELAAMVGHVIDHAFTNGFIARLFHHQLAG